MFYLFGWKLVDLFFPLFFTRQNMRAQKIGYVSEVLRARARLIGIGRVIFPGLYTLLFCLSFFKMCVIPETFCMRKFKTQEETYYLDNITIVPREIVFIVIVRKCNVVSNKSEHKYSPNTYFSAYAFMKKSSFRCSHWLWDLWKYGRNVSWP